MPAPSLAEELKQAITHDDLPRVRELMTLHPALHRAPIGYGNNGPLTWAAECRGAGTPSQARLEIVQWMIDHGSDVHQGGDGPLMRAALNGRRIPMMELLVRNGADVNAEWNGDFPILFAACESLNADGIGWLLAHGADPNCPKPGRTTTALDYLLGTYARSADLGLCVDLLRDSGGTSRYDLPGVLDTATDRADQLAASLNSGAAHVSRLYPELDFGSTAARRLLLTGATLLHVAAEFAGVACARLLLNRGAAVNATGASGQTPIFHSVTQYGDRGLEMTKLLLDHGADVSTRAKLPGLHDQPDHFVECTPLGYALRFPGDDWPGSNKATISLLRKYGALE